MAFLLLSLEFSAPTRVARMALIEHNNNPDFTHYFLWAEASRRRFLARVAQVKFCKGKRTRHLLIVE
jgi:hypothetical protein